MLKKATAMLLTLSLLAPITWPLTAQPVADDCVIIFEAIEEPTASILDTETEVEIVKVTEPVLLEAEEEPEEVTTKSEVETETETELQYRYDDIELLARLVNAEAGNQCEEGIRLVIDVVLNRVDSPDFPNTVTEVLYFPGQWAAISNGSADLSEVREDIVRWILEEQDNRVSTEALYFRTKHYHTFGTPLFQVGDHYFSTK